MSKSRHFSKTVSDDYEYEDRRPRTKKNPPDKRKERRIARALKTRNVDQYMEIDDADL